MNRPTSKDKKDWLVYADWCMSQSDSEIIKEGEFIALYINRNRSIHYHVEYLKVVSNLHPGIRGWDTYFNIPYFS